MRKPIPWLDSWLNFDLFRPPILVFMPKIVFLGPPKNLLKTGFQGYLNIAIFDIKASVGGLEFYQESSHGIGFLIG